MKKNIILISMFILLFLFGNNSVYAKLTCEVGDAGCTDDTIEASIKEEYPSYTLNCLYEVKYKDKKNNDVSAYTFILYNTSDENYYGGTTKFLDGDINVISGNINDGPVFVLGEAYTKLTLDKQCPNFSYIDYVQDYEVCFDDNEECLNDGKILQSFTDFRNTISSKRVINEVVNSSYEFKTACTASNELYKKYNGNVCRYRDNESGSLLLLYYNEDSSEIYWRYGKSGNSVIIESGASKNIVPSNTGGIIGGQTKTLTNSVMGLVSCPSNLPVYISSNNAALMEMEVYSSVEDLVSGKVAEGVDSSIIQSRINYSYINYSCSNEKPEDPNAEIECGDIFTTDVKKYINLALNIIRIGVPILLICLIIYDLFMAVLANDEKKVNDVKSRIIKRLIIAVVIFLVSTLINFVFNLVNESLGTKYEICNLNENASE